MLGIHRNNEYCEKISDKIEYTDRFNAFLQMGGEKKESNIEYIMFISKMKQEYFKVNSFSKNEVIMDHDDFTTFIFSYVDGWLAAGNDLQGFLNERL